MDLVAEADAPQPLRIKFASLGLVVLDEIHFPSKATQKDVVGGSGSHATLGARLFQPASKSLCIGWTIRAGSDFPSPIRSNLESWNTTFQFIEDPSQMTTRGCLEYLDESHDSKRFNYVTPILGVRPEHLRGTPLLDSSIFHLLAEPEEAITTIRDLLELRHQSGIDHRPLIIWEPRPSSCVPSNLKSFYQAMAMVDVFSPNHIELGVCFGHSFIKGVDLDLVERLATTMLESGFQDGREGAIVIRAAEHGSLVVAHPSTQTWCPAFYQSSKHDSGLTVPHPKIIDPTGAGNAFLGGYAIGLQETSDFVQAASYGTVAASFALEQIGLPVLGKDPCSGEEVWNNCGVIQRLKDYESRLKEKK